MAAQKNSNDAFYAATTLPTSHGDFKVRIYRDGGTEHLLISAGELNESSGLLVRVHSECLTSEVLGSLKCDCKAQLDTALALIQEHGHGAVVYLRQEGRGIGLGNKIRAYGLQESGADTVDANRLLGFEDDLRRYDVAGEMLRAAGVKSVRLMTNNPEKLKGLAEAGIQIDERVDCVAGINSINRAYVQTKQDRMGHLYDMNAQTQPRKKVAG